MLVLMETRRGFPLLLLHAGKVWHAVHHEGWTVTILLRFP